MPNNPSDKAYEWFCPQCARTMRNHCPFPNRCRWVFCAFCNIIKETRGAKRHIKLFKDKELDK